MPSWFQFLRIEADLATSFIDGARIQSNPANSARSFGNAHKALAEIYRGLMRPTICGLSEDEVLFLKRRCTEIESALVLLPCEACSGLWREDAAAAAEKVDLDGKLRAAALLGDMDGAWTIAGALEAAGARSRATREKVRKHEAKAHPDTGTGSPSTR